MKIKLITISSLFILNGCQATAPTMKNRISFEMDNKYWPIHSIVYKNNWPECGNLSGTPDAIKKQKYITTYSHCKVSPEGYVPEKIIIEYAPWLTYEEQIKKGYGVPEELRYGGGEEAAKKKTSYKGSTTGWCSKNSSHCMETDCTHSPSRSRKI
ncbi:hypothetical protein [Acinetobacter terrae]|uniref:hypothetical protein n=1 Tax=Acinetobacter terrae TaxID=2731247 RepID=UPI001D1954C1|nr:hypothetical protein [Acinetobacter terrae]